MAEEIFLNTTIPGFKRQEDELIRQGYLEKKYTRTTQKEIERALRRYILKQAPAGVLNTPNKVAAFEPIIDAEIQKLYLTGPTGEKYLKIKMYVPSLKLQRERDAAMLAEEIAAEEEFAPGNYAEMVSLAEKAEDLTKDIINKVRVLTPTSPPNKIKSAIENSSKVKARVIKMLPKVQASPDVADRISAAINTLTRAEAYSQAIRAEHNRPINELTAMMAATNFGTRVQIRPNGAWVERPEYTNYSPELVAALEEILPSKLKPKSMESAAAINNMMGSFGLGKGGKAKRHTRRRRHSKRRHTRRN